MTTNMLQCENNKWISQFIPWGTNSGALIAIVPITEKISDAFGHLDFDKIYKCTVGITKRTGDLSHGNSAFLRKVPQGKNIDGTDSLENLLIEFSSKNIGRDDLLRSAISIKIGDPYNDDHPLLHVAMKG